MTGGWGEVLATATRRLAEAGLDSPRSDAEWLAAHVAGVSRGALIVADAPDVAQRDRFWGLVAARRQRRPLQHLLGTAPFWRGELAVGDGVFVPRPETELLVEWALRAISRLSRPVVVDLCAGSGAIGHAIVTERPDASVWLVERYPQALRWLRRNMSNTVAVIVEGDATSPGTIAERDGECDAVLSNPPYIPRATEVSPEAAADPDTALFGGADGLSVIRPLVARATSLLKPGGVVAMEHDDTHGESVPALLVAAGFIDVADHRDLAGRPRFATGRKPHID